MILERINVKTGVVRAPLYPNDDGRLGTLVLHLRLKDKHSKYLDGLAKQVNTVWNFCNEHSFKVLQREHRFCSAFDLHPYLVGSGKAGLDLHSQTIQGVAEEFVTRRKQFKKSKLKWRVSHGRRKSLGWIPFKSSAITYKGGQVHLAGKALSLWDSYGLANYDLGSGNIAQDARGRWFINLTVTALKWPCRTDIDKDTNENQAPRTAIGIDLGLKDLLVTSDGQKIEAQKFYRKSEIQLAVAQRAGQAKRIRAIHAKTANRRKDFSQKLTTQLVRSHSAIFVGNVSASGLAQTTMAKSVLDASWSQIRTQLKYKCDHAGVVFLEVAENYTTQECSSCHARTGPKGLKDLDVRSWTCSLCHALHDRDTNAAINIKSKGLMEMAKLALLQSLVELELTKPLAAEAKACETVKNKDRSKVVSGVGHDPLVAGIPVL